MNTLMHLLQVKCVNVQRNWKALPPLPIAYHTLHKLVYVSLGMNLICHYILTKFCHNFASFSGSVINWLRQELSPDPEMYEAIPACHSFATSDQIDCFRLIN